MDVSAQAERVNLPFLCLFAFHELGETYLHQGGPSALLTLRIQTLTSSRNKPHGHTQKRSTNSLAILSPAEGIHKLNHHNHLMQKSHQLPNLIFLPCKTGILMIGGTSSVDSGNG